MLFRSDRLTQEEILTSLREPSRNIKSGYESELVVKKNGDTVAGRLVTSNDQELRLLSPGNIEVRISRDEIAVQRPQTESMMPKGLLDGLTDQDVNDLLAYLGTRITVEKIGRKQRLVRAVGFGALIGIGLWFAYRFGIGRSKR